MKLNANTVNIPKRDAGLYNTPGIDFLRVEDIDGETVSEHVEWVEVGQWQDPEERTGYDWDAILDALQERGLRAVPGTLCTWVSDEYDTAEIEAL